MQFIDLKAQYAQLKTDIASRITTVLDHGQYILGPEVKELETQLAAYVGVKHCIGVANGTDALMLALMALGLKPGDEVITTAFTFIATGEMIALLGAVPVFVDIDPNTYNIDVSKIEAAITPKTKMIMPVSLYGQCADMNLINAIATKHGLQVIEDAAQSFGATYRGKKSCGLSKIGCTSFFPSKPLGCYGDGGALFTDDDAVANTLRQLRAHGQEKRYYHPIIGTNSRLDTLQAAILLAKFAVFPDEVEARARVAAHYDRLLYNKAKVAQVTPGNTSVYAQYTIEVSNRSQVQDYLKNLNIPTAVHYPLTLNRQPAFAHFKTVTLPHAERAAERVMSLPMHPYLTQDEQGFIVKHLVEAMAACGEQVS
jgi:UDP-2-acetamido-2-deoxy-ribo-hexuluronate aminotransferase